MRKLAIVCLALGLGLPSSAFAVGVNLRWDSCYGEGSGTLNRGFACGDNAATHLMVGSFVPLANIPQAKSLVAVVDLAAGGATLPAWWQFQGAGCRSGALSADLDTNPSNLVCDDFGQGGFASGGLASFTPGVHGPNTARFVLTSAYAPPQTVDLFRGIEYFAFNLSFTSAKSTGVDACAGCGTGVCIVLNSVQIWNNVTPAIASIAVAGNGVDSNYITWQGGGNPTVGTVTGCPAATPTARRTWAQVKSLYR
jgi:hypothetical protein